MRDGFVHILDIKRNVVAADVAVARRLSTLIHILELEELDIRAILAAKHFDLWDHGSRVDIELSRHKVPIVIAEWADREDFDTSDKSMVSS